MRRRAVLRLAGSVVAIVLATVSCTGCTGGSHPAARRSGGDPLLVRDVPGAVTVRSRAQRGVGPILTDGAGHALYMFPPDARSRVTCTGPCAGTWPTLTIARGAHPRAAGRARADLLGVVPDPTTGAQTVTYAGNPLYRYAGDVTASTANGQGIFLNGGPWYLLSPEGDTITNDIAQPGRPR